MALPELVQQLSQSGSDISRLLDALELLNPDAEIDQDDGYRQLISLADTFGGRLLFTRLTV
jgi:hypothetical protein